MYISTYLKPHKWSYLKERIEVSNSTQQTQGIFKITSAIRKPWHVFIWALNDAKIDYSAENPFLFNTYNVANARTITMAQLELTNGIYYPQEQMNPTNELVKTYRTLLQYNKSFNDFLTASSIDIENFQNLYGMIYFDLRNQETELRSGTTKLNFRFTLNGAPNAPYTCYSLVLYEEEIEVIMSCKAMLKA